MAIVNAEVLFMIFKLLESVDKVRMMRVCRGWLDLLEANQVLWKELKLPITGDGWGTEALQHFDRQSNSSLERVLIKVRPDLDLGNFMKVLERSQATLQVVDIRPEHAIYRETLQPLDASLKKLRNLVDFRIIHPISRPLLIKHQVRVAHASSGIRRDPTRPNGHQDHSYPRILSIFNAEILATIRPDFADHLVSLSGKGLSSSQWRNLLERPSRTLKHLRISLFLAEDDEHLPDLYFPNLVALELSLSHGRPGCLLWLKTPSSCTLIIEGTGNIFHLPSCSRLWADLPRLSLVELEAQLPELVELRSAANICNTWYYSILMSMLKLRKQNVEAGMEIGGVRMIPLKTLTIPFDGMRSQKVAELREMVEELVDSGTVSNLIELDFNV